MTAPAVTATPPPAAAPAAPAAVTGDGLLQLTPPVRIRAGNATAFKDSAGQTWLPGQGFAGGDTVDRADDLRILNTPDPGLYRSEHYDVTGFSCHVPNGKYQVKLHFAETYESIDGPGQRVFSVNVQGHEIKDLDVFARAGGALRAYVETANVDVTDGTLKITFTPNVQSPEINGLEILPAS
jgi:hypothetical protein